LLIYKNYPYYDSAAGIQNYVAISKLKDVRYIENEIIFGEMILIFQQDIPVMMFHFLCPQTISIIQLQDLQQAKYKYMLHSFHLSIPILTEYLLW
jgi:hypothetical protein